MVKLTPDGRYYLAMHKRRVPRPFHLRWFLPVVLRANLKAWQAVTRISIVAVAIFTVIYTGNLWMACVAFLPKLTTQWRYPVLTDAYGLATALAAALAAMNGWWPAAIALTVLAGCARETAPVWAAVFAWNPILLVGLAPVAVRWLQKPGVDTSGDQGAYLAAHPIKAGQAGHRGHWFNPYVMIVPWGGLIAGIALLGVDVNWWGFAGKAQLVVALTVAYAQLLVATDCWRLYQWATPVLALACVTALPAWLLPFVALTVVFNAWSGATK